MSSSPVRFKDEIRRSFIFYALIPALIFSLVVFIATAIIWNWRLYSHSVAENKCVTEVWVQPKLLTKIYGIHDVWEFRR